MLVLTKNKIVDAGEEKVLVQEYQFSGDNYPQSFRYCAAHEQFLPWPGDDAFPHAIAREVRGCVLFIWTRVWNQAFEQCWHSDQESRPGKGSAVYYPYAPQPADTASY